MTFDKWYELLKEYINKYQKIPSIREQYNEFKLDGWCHHQRGNYKDKKLEDSQIKKLEQISGWYWNKKDKIVVKGKKKINSKFILTNK